MQSCNTCKKEVLEQARVKKRDKWRKLAAFSLCTWKEILAKQLLLHRLKTPVRGSSSVDINITSSKCLNDSSRAYSLKLGVASSLATALEIVGTSAIKCSVFPAWPPGVYEL